MARSRHRADHSDRIGATKVVNRDTIKGKSSKTKARKVARRDTLRPPLTVNVNCHIVIKTCTNMLDSTPMRTELLWGKQWTSGFSGLRASAPTTREVAPSAPRPRQPLALLAARVGQVVPC